MNIETIGVVGLGNMGLGMAATLARKGFAVIGYDISDARRAAVEA
ncbi:NAD(P)-dependent oxidoreductase, partial [Methylobacterium sp. WL64]